MPVYCYYTLLQNTRRLFYGGPSNATSKMQIFVYNKSKILAIFMQNKHKFLTNTMIASLKIFSIGSIPMSVLCTRCKLQCTGNKSSLEGWKVHEKCR